MVVMEHKRCWLGLVVVVVAGGSSSRLFHFGFFLVEPFPILHLRRTQLC